MRFWFTSSDADLEPGKVTVSLEHATLGSPAWQFPVVPERDTVVLEVVMPAGRSIRGRVTDAATGEPIGDLRGELRGVTAPSEGVSVRARRIALDRWMVVEVVGPDGGPIAGVRVQCWGRGVHPRSRTATTDESGRVVVKDLPPEPLTVMAHHLPTRVGETRLQHPQPVEAVPDGQTLRLQFGEKVESRK